VAVRCNGGVLHDQNEWVGAVHGAWLYLCTTSFCVVASVSCHLLRSSFFGATSSKPSTTKKIEPGFSSLLYDARYSKGASVCGICMHTATIKNDNTLFLWLLLLCVGWCWGRIRSVAQAFRAHDLCNDFTCARICHAQRHMLFDLPGATRDRS